MDTGALWDRTSDEIRENFSRFRALGRIVTALSSYRDEGVTKHAIVVSEGEADQRIELEVPSIEAPFVIARHAREGFHPTLVGMVGPASKPEMSLVFARFAPDVTPPKLVLPTPFRDEKGTFFATRTAFERGVLISIAAAGAPVGARGEGLSITGIWAPQPSTRVAWAVHLDAMNSADRPWRDRWEVRTLETVAHPVMALPIASETGERWVLSLWHDRVLSPWPAPDPFAHVRRFEVDEGDHAGAIGDTISRRRAEDRAVIAIGGGGSRYLVIHGSPGVHAPLERHFAAVSPGEDPPKRITKPPPEQPVSHHPIDRFVLAHMRETGARHGQIAVVRGRKLAFAKAYTFAEEGYPIARLDDAYRLGSVSKALTAIVISRALASRGLDMDARVVDALGFAPGEGPPALASLTIRHLLTHKAGFWTFPDVRPDEPKNPLSEGRITGHFANGSPAARPGQLSALLRALRDDATFARAPGSAADPDYSNEGFILLGEALSALALGRPDAYERAMTDLLFRAAGVDPGPRGCLFGAGRKQARSRREAPAHPSSPTWAPKRFADDLDPSPVTLSPYADNGPFLGGAAGIAVPLVWVARVLAELGPNRDGTGFWGAREAEIAATPAARGSSIGHGFHLGEPGFWTFRPSGGGAPLTVRVRRLHHNGRLDGGAALLMHLMPHDPREASDATLSVVAAFNQLGPLYDDPHGKRLLGILRQLEGSPGWDSDLFERLGDVGEAAPRSP